MKEDPPVAQVLFGFDPLLLLGKASLVANNKLLPNGVPQTTHPKSTWFANRLKHAAKGRFSGPNASFTVREPEAVRSFQLGDLRIGWWCPMLLQKKTSTEPPSTMWA